MDFAVALNKSAALDLSKGTQRRLNRSPGRHCSRRHKTRKREEVREEGVENTLCIVWVPDG